MIFFWQEELQKRQLTLKVELLLPICVDMLCIFVIVTIALIL
nr:MAG TPA: hypothetical protein [Bacteriophage sp.]